MSTDGRMDGGRVGALVNARFADDRATLTFKEAGGGIFNAVFPYRPFFYLVKPPGSTENEEDAQVAAQSLAQHPLVTDCRVEKKQAHFLAKTKEPVVRVEVTAISSLDKVARDCKRAPGAWEITESKVPHWLKFASVTGARFWQTFNVVWDKSNKASLRLSETSKPALDVAVVRRAPNGSFEWKTTSSVAQNVSRGGLNEALGKANADVVFSWGGDDWLRGVPGSANGGYNEETGFTSCQHVDLKRDFATDIYLEELGETAAQAAAVGGRLDGWGPDLDALLAVGKLRAYRLDELAGLTGASFEIVARATPGQLNTFLHYFEAVQRGVLIPDGKPLLEKPKTIAALLSVDKGGTILYPSPGVYRNVAKFDFASMYPSLIVKHNLSPDALDCSCCLDAPSEWEGGPRLCRKTRGLIGQGLAKVLERRLLLKARKRSETDPARREEWDWRQRALKNILVTCFGYLGYNRFVFSNVECKELVMLHGRQALQTTIDVAREHGLTPIYGMVDSLFVSGGSREECAAFAHAVDERTGLQLDLDHWFSAIVFPAGARGEGVANKYYALDEKGEIEARGIRYRHSDAPLIVKQFQAQAIPALLNAPTWEQGVQAARGVLAVFAQSVARHDAPMESLAITQPLHKPLASYAGRSPHVRAFKEAPNNDGMSTYAFTVHGPRPVSKIKLETSDVPKYAHLLNQAFIELTNVR